MRSELLALADDSSPPSSRSSKSVAERKTVNPQSSQESSEDGNADSASDPTAAGKTASKRELSEVWRQFYRRRKPEPELVADLILELNGAGKHEHVIAAIEAALVTGYSQPWMYDVLAVSMEIVGRPKAEIERVLLSQIDFTAVDVPSMLYSAAVLTRLGREEQALHLYRQASRLAPERAEAYALGLKLATQAKDDDAVLWAATGILQHVWKKGYEQQHRKAENAALDARQRLRERGDKAGLKAFDEALTVARRRDLVLKLEWSGSGDLDMSVEEPFGTICSLEVPQTQGGGVLTHDGAGPKQQNCYEEYVCPQAFPGEYRVRVRHITGRIVGKRAVLTVIRQQNTPKESKERIPVVLEERDSLITVTLADGRRKKVARFVDEAPELLFVGGGKRPSSNRVFRPGAKAAAKSRVAADRFAASRNRMGIPRGRNSAVGFQPVIAVIPEGVRTTATAVISADRRYVRLTLNPVFSSLTDVFTFSYQSFGGQGAGGQGNGRQGAGGGQPGN